MLAKTAFCAALLLSTSASADEPVRPPQDRITVTAHGETLLLNGQPLGSRFALEQKCTDMRGRLAGAPASLYSDVNTPEAKLDQIAAILKRSCGAAYVTVVVRLNPTPDKH